MNSAEMAFKVANDWGTLQSSGQTMATALLVVRQRIFATDSVEVRAAVTSIEFALEQWKRTAKQIGVEHGCDD